MSLDSYVHLADDAINQTFADEAAPKPVLVSSAVVR